jgi:two-component system chemotaxis response regulator CheB
VSTGGPKALMDLLPRLPADLPVPVAIVQHMPALFTKQLARSLSQKTALPVEEAGEGAPLEPGTIWIAPGDYHIRVVREGLRARLRLNQEPPENACRPAVDPLFRSVAETYGMRALAAVLTGMGRDGLRGAEAIRAAGGTVLAQDEASSVVWGMPGEVVRAGLAEETLALGPLAESIISRVGAGRPGWKGAVRV